ncbi:MAG TPA: YdcF family protein [Rhizomicrobium sp.]|nr:YdcF family protein [Rhizomicrobium sp.]
MRGALAFLTLLLAAYVAGFLMFVNEVAKPPMPPAPADGVVALTGGPLRLEAAAALLEKKTAKRLLITGVAASATKEDLKHRVHGRSRFDCCADLGFFATDTHSNAEETADWAREHNYKSLIIVTTNYHMPRSLAEFSALMPGVRLEPWPVPSQGVDVAQWWRNPHTILLLNGEYLKYLASLVMTRMGA